MSGPAKEAPRYQIVFLNDDFTPMEFVVHVLEDIFKMSREEATRAMLHTHTGGEHCRSLPWSRPKPRRP